MYWGGALALVVVAGCSGGSEASGGEAGAGAMGGSAAMSGGAGKGGGAGSAGASGKGGGGGSSGASGSSNNAGAAGSTGAAAGGAAGESGAGAGGESAGEGGVPNSMAACNPPPLDVPVVNEGGEIAIDGGDPEDAADWIDVRSSRYYCASSAGVVLPEERWVAEIENTGTSLLCDVQITPAFYDANGEELAELPAAAVYAATHARPDMTRHYCIEPGETGFASGVRLATIPLDASAIAEVRYSAEGEVFADAVPKTWATLSDVEVMANESGTYVRGVATNGAASLAWWNVRYFFHDADGSIIGAVEALDSSVPVEANRVFEFETVIFPGVISTHVGLVEHGDET